MFHKIAIRICIIAGLFGLSANIGAAKSISTSKELTIYAIPMSAPKILGLTLLESTFSDAFNMLGTTTKFRLSGEDGSPIAACYRSVSGEKYASLILESDYTGAWVNISGYILTSTNSEKYSHCASSQLVTQKLRVLDNHAWLGMTKKEVIQNLGKPRVNNLDNWNINDLPTNKNKNHWVYLTTWAKPFTESDKRAAEKSFGADGIGANPHWDVWTYVELKFEKSKVVEIYVHHGISD